MFSYLLAHPLPHLSVHPSINHQIPFRFPLRETLFLAVASAGACFSIYLLYVIKVVLQDFCIVCASFHAANFCMLVLAILEYRSPSIGGAVGGRRKKQ